MDVHLSIKAKLVVSAQSRQELKFAMEEFNRACNTLSELAFQRDLHRRYDIHHQGYRLIRQETDLPSQHVINAIAKVSAVYARAPDNLNGAKSVAARHDLVTMGRYHCEYPRKEVNRPEAARSREFLPGVNTKPGTASSTCNALAFRWSS
jgi:predicted transposase